MGRRISRPRQDPPRCRQIVVHGKAKHAKAPGADRVPVRAGRAEPPGGARPAMNGPGCQGPAGGDIEKELLFPGRQGVVKKVVRKRKRGGVFAVTQVENRLRAVVAVAPCDPGPAFPAADHPHVIDGCCAIAIVTGLLPTRKERHDARRTSRRAGQELCVSRSKVSGGIRAQASAFFNPFPGGPEKRRGGLLFKRAGRRPI